METLTLSQTKAFSYKQLDALEKGSLKRERMRLLIANITEADPTEKYNNLYIFSPPGLGKTFTVTEQLTKSPLQHFLVTGNTSMFAFGIQLAVIQYMNQENLPLIIHVDDCDEIFKNEMNCNTMKKILDTDRKFVYEKSLSSQTSSMSPLQQDAINYFNEEGKMGFVVPADNLRFIFTSNFQLPFDDEVAAARKKSKTKAVLLAHRNAIRSRCKVADFDLDKEEHWGWIADVVLNTECLFEYELDQDEKVLILDFLWYNWSYLTERSIRLIEKMAHTMKLYPLDFKTIWEIDYRKH